jgi:TonB family protein
MHVAPIRIYLAFLAARIRLGALICCSAVALSLSFSAQAQTPQPATPDAAQQPEAPPAQTGDTQQPASPAPSSADNQAPQQTPQQTPPAPADQAPASPAAPATPQAPAVPPAAQAAAAGAWEAEQGGISEEELRRLLVGKALYLRGGYLDNSLSFDENGRITGRSPQGSYTLSAIQIDKVHLTKHKVTLEGARYGLHFVGQLAYEDPAKAVDRVRITPPKKQVKITIDREIVVKPKKKKESKAEKEREKKANSAAAAAPKTPAAAAPAATAASATPAAPGTEPAAEPPELSEADQLKASIAATPEAERPADPTSVTTTLSPAHATRVLKDALDKIFAQGLDDRMMAAMPDFWKLYYQAVADKADYRPTDPSILRQNTVDQKARLLSRFEPDSNEYAQASGVAGMALYHTVIGPDGKAGEIAVARPIGFGLDENAVETIRKASFQPAIKDGKPVPVLLDLVVQFRIFSKRTAVHAEPEPADKPAEPVLPGPYSLPRP